MYLCFYDLQKAFDSVQYPILLKRLYDAGINGKTWRLLRNWYHKPKSSVRVGGQLSPVYTLERGVLQGSVLAPTLFLLTLDPLLRKLEHNNLGPSIHGTYVGAFAHADDIRTVTSSLSSLQQQIHMIGKFAKDNALSLNPSKCEVVIIAPSRPTNSTSICTLNDQPLLPKQNAKCLGFWWLWDLSATKAIDEAITKAGRAYFCIWKPWSLSEEAEPPCGEDHFRSVCHPSTSVWF